MLIIRSFLEQLNGALTFRPLNPGTEFIVTIPQFSA
jgi:hypothetical protein